MKSSYTPLPKNQRISRQLSLPLLRGMFILPKPLRKNKKKLKEETSVDFFDYTCSFDLIELIKILNTKESNNQVNETEARLSPGI